jgi:glutathionylspermidine synthase
MRRQTERPRSGWEAIVESQGLIYHHTDKGVYWDESASYRFSSRQIDTLEAATNELHARCLDAAQHIIDNNRFAELGIPEFATTAIVKAWNEEPPSIYGRFDFIYSGVNQPKLLEYNADTPTALIEAAVVQWYWKEAVRKGSDQFNSIHERLVEKWQELKGGYLLGDRLFLASTADPQAEDMMTASYMRETAHEAGLPTETLTMGDIGWTGDHFVTRNGTPMQSIFKLYPWEWMVWEEFGKHAIASPVQWIEPIWKMLWSNKALLAILWELFPHHPNLVPAYLGGARDIKDYVKKPKMSREGANITVVRGGQVTETQGDYGEEGFVYQQFIEPVNEHHPVIGSWVIDGVAAGIGIRESSSLVTDNACRFVPHYFD